MTDLKVNFSDLDNDELTAVTTPDSHHNDSTSFLLDRFHAASKVIDPPISLPPRAGPSILKPPSHPAPSSLQAQIGAKIDADLLGNLHISKETLTTFFQTLKMLRQIFMVRVKTCSESAYWKIGTRMLGSQSSTIMFNSGIAATDAASVP